MTTELNVANLAVAHLAIGRPIGAMNENTQAAKVMTQYYGQARDEAFRAFNWPFARKIATAVNIAGPSPAASIDFACSYQYPADCIAVRDVIIAPRRPGVPGPSIFVPDPGFLMRAYGVPHTPYRIGTDGTQLLIFTDAAPDTTDSLPQLEYTIAQPEALWPPDFAAAVSFRLAWYAAPALTAGDPHQLGVRAIQAYADILSQARADARNEQQDDPDPDSQFITARD